MKAAYYFVDADGTDCGGTPYHIEPEKGAVPYDGSYGLLDYLETRLPGADADEAGEVVGAACAQIEEQILQALTRGETEGSFTHISGPELIHISWASREIAEKQTSIVSKGGLAWTFNPFAGAWCADGDGFHVVYAARSGYVFRCGELRAEGTAHHRIPGDDIEAALDAADEILRAGSPDMHEYLSGPR